MEQTADSLVRFQGRYLARKIRYLQAGIPETDITLDQIETGPSVVDADHAPPQNAVPASSVLLPLSAIVDEKSSGGAVEYPVQARFNHVSGVVWLDMTIRSDGSVADLHPVSGPPVLQQASVKGVSTWRFAPHQIAGHPVNVRTRISVVFSLSP